MEDADKLSTNLAAQAGFQQVDLAALQSLLSEGNDPIASMYTSEIIDPTELQFIPSSSWNSKLTSLQALQETYFSRKNNINRRFEHKLWNALRITTVFPQLTKLVGVCWVSDTVFKVYKHPFAKLLNISCIDGGLFHKQGNFTRHGFISMPEQVATKQLNPEQIDDVDYRDVLLLYHSQMMFTSSSTEMTISSCKWDNPTPATRVATLRIDTNLPDST